MKGTIKKFTGIDVDITIRDRRAQLIMSVGIFILLMGIAYSFYRGWSVIKVIKAAPGYHRVMAADGSYKL